MLWNALSGPSWAIAICFIVFHGILLPLRGAAILDISPKNFFLPLLPSFVVAIVLAPTLFVPSWIWGTGTWTLMDLAIGGASYAIAYGIVGGVFLLTPTERQRIWAILMPPESSGFTE